ncbi:MAG TPA: hypothetical protein VE218_06085, partial [Acidobacteriaceae bacterium]|nr:hypothetical protein [Acidobacteriaceae bacterium]
EPVVEPREPVEVHRIEPDPVEAEAAAPPQATHLPDPYPEAASPTAAPQAAKKEARAKEVGRTERKAGVAPLGRWEEFREPRGLKPEPGDRIHLELAPSQRGFSSMLLSADLEREPRSSFLTLAVPGIAALLVVGALLWSGWLRAHVKQQDAAMSALQEQNRKLADSLAQMTVKPAADAAVAPQNGAISQPPKAAPGESQPQAGQGENTALSGQAGLPVHEPDRKGTAGQSERLQGVSVPPPIQSPVHGHGRSPVPQKGSTYDRPPEIVPPYPTLAYAENAGAPAAGQPPANAGAYRAPFTPGAYQQPVAVTESDRRGTSPGTTSRTALPQAPAVTRLPTPSAASNGTAATTSSNATQYDAGIGSYANLLAQNVETVEGLQRHSPVQLIEFHARAGVPTRATPTVRLSVQHPDQGSGSYALVVGEGGSSYQLRGEVNRPLAFTDTATHRRYGLVVLSIAGEQVYGYLRAMQ